MSNALTSTAKKAVPLIAIDQVGFKNWCKTLTPRERDWLKGTGFEGSPGKFVFLPDAAARSAKVIVGANLKTDALWALGSLPYSLPEGRYHLQTKVDAAASNQLALGWALGAYCFSRYKAAPRAPASLVWPERCDRKEVEHLVQSIYLARDLINTPCEDMGPQHLAAAAKAVAKQFGARIKVIVGDDLLKQNYPTIHAVGRASARPPCLIDIRWGNPKHPKVTLVGKGVCFDTGGLDLKSAAGMLDMKKDMGGAAVVLTLARSLMAGKAPICLRVLIPAVENSVSANSIRPRDIVRTRSGKTVEIGNTDAEGRLILCDALFEADSESPDMLIDCATLTGAARVALGPEVHAMFSDDDKLAEDIVRAGTEVHDAIWRLPLWKPYRKMLDSNMADFNNVSGGGHAGAIVAALYLAEFVRPATAWAHLDMMAANVTAKPGRPEGGEATGLRALYRVIRKRFG